MALCVLPLLVALGLLVAGVSVPSLVLVYSSIAASMLAVPALVVGVVLVVKGVRG